MTVVSAVPEKTAPRGNHSTGANYGYRVTYNVNVSDVYDGPDEIHRFFAARVDLPYIGGSYLVPGMPGEVEPNLVCLDLASVRRDNSQTEWITTVSYGTISMFSGAGETGAPVLVPSQRRREFRFGFAPRQVVVSEAAWWGVWSRDPAGERSDLMPGKGFYANRAPATGQLLTPCSSGNQPFVPGAVKDQSDTIFICRTPLSTSEWDPVQADLYVDAVNDGPIKLDLKTPATIYNFLWEINKYQLKCASADAVFVAEPYLDASGASQIDYYWDTTFEFHFRRGIDYGESRPATERYSGWAENYPDVGSTASAFPQDPDGEEGTQPPPGSQVAGQTFNRKLVDANGYPLSDIPLDGEGQPLEVIPDYSSSFWNEIRFINFLSANNYAFQTIPRVGFQTWSPA